MRIFCCIKKSFHITCLKILFLSFSYNNLLEQKDGEVLKMCERLDGGLQKLADATEQLNELNEKLAVQKVSAASS